MALDRRTAAVAVLVVLAAGAIGVAAGAVVSSGSGTGTPVGVSGPAATDEATEQPEPPSTPPAPSPSPGATVPVYVLGGSAPDVRLYREFRQVAVTPAADEVRLSLAAMGLAPVDPDYRTPWAGVPLTAVRRSGADATVTFGSAPRTRPGEAALAVQQVVHTVTAADPTLKRVRVVAPGIPAALTAAPLPRADQQDVLGPVWLVDPADGARTGGTVVLSGTASVFEATVSVEVRKDGAIVARATATAKAGAPQRGEWTATVRLAPGGYLVAAYESSAKDGSKRFEDTKRITVT